MRTALVVLTRSEAAFTSLVQNSKNMYNCHSQSYKKVINKITKIIRVLPDRGLTFQPLNLSNWRLRLYANGIFAHNGEASSQLGLITFLLMTQEKADPIMYRSYWCKHTTRFVFSAETFVLTYSIDQAILVQKHVALFWISSSYTNVNNFLFFDCCNLKWNLIMERIFLIDALHVNPSYQFGNISGHG